MNRIVAPQPAEIGVVFAGQEPVGAAGVDLVDRRGPRVGRRIVLEHKSVHGDFSRFSLCVTLSLIGGLVKRALDHDFFHRYTQMDTDKRGGSYRPSLSFLALRAEIQILRSGVRA